MKNVFVEMVFCYKEEEEEVGIGEKVRRWEKESKEGKGRGNQGVCIYEKDRYLEA